MTEETKTDNSNDIKEALFAVYLNQAQHNAYIILNHIRDKLSLGAKKQNKPEDSAVLESLVKTDNPTESSGAYELVDEHFPVLKHILKREPDKSDSVNKDDTENTDDNNRNKLDQIYRAKRYREILTQLLKALNAKRNFYSHKNSEDKFAQCCDKAKVINFLEYAFDESVEIVRNRLDLPRQDKDNIPEKKDIRHLLRVKPSKEGNNKEDNTPNPDFQYHFKDENGTLTEKGLAFLMCLFLNKRDTYTFLRQSGLKGFKRDDTPAMRASTLSYRAYRAVIPKSKITSYDDKTTLLLDILGDLEKCPKELYGLLGKEDKDTFRPAPQKEEGQNQELNLKKRYSDRFADFLLRYCDYHQKFRNLRFQVRLGRFYFKCYPKETIDGETTIRRLDKQLKAFGRISDIKLHIQQQWEDLLKAPNEIDKGYDKPYIQKIDPRYNIVNNQVGIYLLDDDRFRRGKDAQLPGLNGKLEKPDAWLSVYSLAGMVFCGLKCRGGFDRAEGLIRGHIENRKKALKEVIETGKLPEKDKLKDRCPESLLRFADKKQSKSKDQLKYAERKLEKMITDTGELKKRIEKQLRDIDDKSGSPGEGGCDDIKAGRLADYLARDMVKLQPFAEEKNGKDKTTAPNFQVLQKTLARFSADKDSLEQMFKQLGLTEGDNRHPFLGKLKAPEKYNDTIDYYRDYLAERLKYLEKLCKGEPAELKNLQFLRPARSSYINGNRDIKQLAEELLKQPANIPADAFKDAVSEFVTEQIPSLKDRTMNTAFMINKWFEKNEGSPQPMYGYERVYKVSSQALKYAENNRDIADALKKIKDIQTESTRVKELRKHIKENLPDGKDYPPESPKGAIIDMCRYYRNNERALRRLKTQDTVAFLVLKDMLLNHLKADFSKSDKTKLENIYPCKDDDSKSFLQQEINEAEISLTTEFDSNKNYHKDYIAYIDDKYKDCDSLTKRNNLINLEYKLKLKDTKLKDLGKYRRYFYDRRLPGLLLWEYKPGDEIVLKEIEDELAEFERLRPKIAVKLFDFEKTVIDKYNMQPKGDKDYIDFCRVIEKAKNNLSGFDNELDTVHRIRNAVFHNQFPAPSKDIKNVKTAVINGEAKEAKLIAHKIKGIADDYIKALKAALRE